jgi:type IV secretory pathway VirB2 component (pilin)
MSEQRLQTLKTANVEEGWDLAVKMSRMAVSITQPSEEARTRLRAIYAENADSLIAVSHVVAINFQTIAAANNYWRT